MKIGTTPHPASTLSVIDRGVKRTVQIHPCQQWAINFSMAKIAFDKKGIVAEPANNLPFEKFLFQTLNSIPAVKDMIAKEKTPLKGARFVSNMPDYASYGKPEGFHFIIPKLPNS